MSTDSLRVMSNKHLLYQKLNALRLEVDGSIVDDIKSTVDNIFQEQLKEQLEKPEQLALWLWGKSIPLDVDKLKELFKRFYLEQLKTNIMEQTFGQKLVRASFNPSKFPEVDFIKQKYADIADMLDDLRSKTPEPEQKRLVSIAITEAQGACMWAVSALTYGI